MSGFGSYYLNLVSITFYTISTSIPFFRKKVFKILVCICICICICICVCISFTTENPQLSGRSSGYHTKHTYMNMYVNIHTIESK